MWFPLLMLLFLLAATYFQAIQGITSAAITCVLAIICLAISFGTYEYVAEAFLVKIKPDYAHAVAMFATFVIPFSILRILLDMWVPRSSLFPQIIDRIGGAALGLIAAFVITGVMALSIQMVPWGQAGILGYQRFNPENPEELNELWLQPDRFATGLAGKLSVGVFSAKKLWTDEHPDLVTEMGSRMSLPRGVRSNAPADSVTVNSAARIPEIYIKREDRSGQGKPPTYDPVDPGPRQVYTRVTLTLGPDALDEDNRHLYTPASVRLLGKLNGEPAVVYGIAAADKEQPMRFVSAVQDAYTLVESKVAGTLLLAGEDSRIDIAFKHDERFKPQFVEYKFGARVPIRMSDDAGQAPAGQASSADPPPSQTADAGPAEPPSDGTVSQPGGRVSGVRFRSSHFGGDLPLTMTAYTAREVENRGTLLIQGHLLGKFQEQGEKHGNEALNSLKVPDGKFLLQLNVERLQAGSTLGKALNFTVQTIENYLVEDDRGKTYEHVGKYAIANVGGEAWVEVLYFPEYAESGGRIGTFDKIKNQHFQHDYQLVYLYLIDPGAKVVKFTTAGSKQPIDLTGLNLVAK